MCRVSKGNNCCRSQNVVRGTSGESRAAWEANGGPPVTPRFTGRARASAGARRRVNPQQALSPRAGLCLPSSPPPPPNPNQQVPRLKSEQKEKASEFATRRSSLF